MITSKVILPDFGTPAESLKSRLNRTAPDSKHFLDNIRKYYQCFQMTSFGAEEVREPGFMTTFKVCGQIYGKSWFIVTSGRERAKKFIQIYFTGDDKKQTALHQKNISNMKEHLVLNLQHMLHQENKYIREFKTAIEQVFICNRGIG